MEKPIPPTIISTGTAVFIIILPLKDSKLSENKEKPALQNAETEWNIE